MQHLKASIRLRLMITFTLLTAVGGLILFLIASERLQDATLEFYERDLESQALIVSNSVRSRLIESNDDNPVDAQTLRTLLMQLRSNNSYDLALFDSSLSVITFTGDASSVVTPASSPPEMRAAQAGNVGRDVRVDSEGSLMAFVAVPISSEESQNNEILELSAPLQPAFDQAQSQNMQLAGVWLPIILLAAAISWWVGQSLARPIQELNGSALRIAGGALNERIQIKSGDEIGQLGTSFNYMVERLNILITAQRRFVSNAAHELRSPLMNLGLRIEALRDERIPDEQKRVYLQEAGDELKRMSDMVTSLLLLARLDEGRHRSADEPFDIVLMLGDVARHWRIQTQRAGLNLKFEIPDTLPPPRISAADLRIILDNLFSNALKYTLSGGEIRLRAVPEKGMLRLDISDSGEGFLPEEGKRLFERFYRIPRSREKPVLGTGLGLSIVREILNLYDGRALAFSEGLGKGSTFSIYIPSE